MKITVELEQEDFDHMHDVVYGALKVQPTNDQIQNIWNALPEDIQDTAIHWGCGDTVFRENMYGYLESLDFDEVKNLLK